MFVIGCNLIVKSSRFIRIWIIVELNIKKDEYFCFLLFLFNMVDRFLCIIYFFCILRLEYMKINF